MTQPGQTTLQRSLSASETDTEAAAEQILLVAARIDHRVDYEVLRPIGLTTRGWRALDAIASHRGLNPSAIAAVAYIRKASLTDILNRLEAMGLIERALHEQDRRRWVIDATTKGRRLHRDIRSSIRRESGRELHRILTEPCDG